jgi:hypothetical protein
MKSRNKELLDRAIAASVAAIEVYNKPDFKYREEAFSVLAINGWELLLKAKWLADNKNDPRSLYVFENRRKQDGKPSKKTTVKLTRSGNPFTHSLDYLARQLVAGKSLDSTVLSNLEALLELRDSSVHFYNRSPLFSLRLQEIGSASLKNFVAVAEEWFGKSLAHFNFYLMPLSFVQPPASTTAIVLNSEEKNFLKFVESLEPKNAAAADKYSVTVNIDVKFTRSKARDALPVQITKDPKATAIRLTDEQIREKFPWDYKRLTDECGKCYSDFKVTNAYHQVRKKLISVGKFGLNRYLDPGNPKSSKKPFFDPNIMSEFDKHYTRKKKP